MGAKKVTYNIAKQTPTPFLPCFCGGPFVLFPQFTMSSNQKRSHSSSLSQSQAAAAALVAAVAQRGHGNHQVNHNALAQSDLDMKARPVPQVCSLFQDGWLYWSGH